MKEYVIPFLAYILVVPLLSSFNKGIAYPVHVFIMLIFLALFWKHYKLSFKFDFLAVLTGILIAVLWVLLADFYPLFKIQFIPASTFFLVLKLMGFILIAPLIEELFTRSFLVRLIIDKNWKKVPIGKFTAASFIISVLFFGFSHNRWLPGLIAGILLNLLLYKQKRIESCIIAHFIANLLLAIYIIWTSSWQLW